MSTTACEMDMVHEQSGHSVTGMAVSVCITPAAPAPLPIPYPTMGQVIEGIVDEPMRTKVAGQKHATVGSCVKTCHGNEPGTLKEVVSFNTSGPSFLTMGAPTVLVELGMAGITGSLVQMNKAITVGAPSMAGDASGDGSGAGAGGGGGDSGGPSGPNGPSGGGGGGGGDHAAAAPPSPAGPAAANGGATGGDPVDVVTGTMFSMPEDDFWLNGLLTTQFKRAYRSSGVRHTCGMGFGWAHSFHFRADVRGAQLKLTDPDFRVSVMRVPESEELVLLPFGRAVGRKGEDLVVYLGGFRYVLRREGESGTYRMAELRDQWENVISLTWEGDELVEILDSVGRRAWVHHDGLKKTWMQSAKDGEGKQHQRLLVIYELESQGGPRQGGRRGRLRDHLRLRRRALHGRKAPPRRGDLQVRLRREGAREALHRDLGRARLLRRPPGHRRPGGGERREGEGHLPRALRVRAGPLRHQDDRRLRRGAPLPGQRPRPRRGVHRPARLHLNLPLRRARQHDRLPRRRRPHRALLLRCRRQRAPRGRGRRRGHPARGRSGEADQRHHLVARRPHHPEAHRGHRPRARRRPGPEDELQLRRGRPPPGRRAPERHERRDLPRRPRQRHRQEAAARRGGEVLLQSLGKAHQESRPSAASSTRCPTTRATTSFTSASRTPRRRASA